MFQSLDELVAQADAVETAMPKNRTMVEVEEFLDREIADGMPASSRLRTLSALRSLLKIKNLTPKSTCLDIEWFDEQFPLDGWDPVLMPKLSQASYIDYRKRVRAAIERVLGVAQKRQAFRAMRDGWAEMGLWLKERPEFSAFGSRRLIPICSTLTMGARHRELQPEMVTQDVFLSMHDAVSDSDTRASYRSASAQIAQLQSDPECKKIWTWMRHPISPIKVQPMRTYDIPENFSAEIEHLTEIAARLRYVTVKETWEYVADETRANYRSTLRALVGAFKDAGYFSDDTVSIRPLLEDADILAGALREWLKWLKQGRWAASTTLQYARTLPCILERNGIEVVELKQLLSEVAEFQDNENKAEMNETTKAFCRALIERPDFRSDFLLSHIPPRMAAQRIMKRARFEKRELKPSEVTKVRQLGTVALFSAIECGGAPIRVSNFLGITSVGNNAWFKIASKDLFELTVPPGHTKNKKRIWAPIRASSEKYHDTIRWYLQHIRPLFFSNGPSGRQTEESPYLVPSVTDPRRPLPYGTFRGWFTRIMRNDVGIVCTPHNFRHGQASLLYHDNPGLLRTIARRLGDTEQTVLENYAWVHAELEAERGQNALVATIRKGGFK
jgi:hypothetical protein